MARMSSRTYGRAALRAAQLLEMISATYHGAASDTHRHEFRMHEEFRQLADALGYDVQRREEVRDAA